MLNHSQLEELRAAKDALNTALWKVRSIARDCDDTARRDDLGSIAGGIVKQIDSCLHLIEPTKSGG